MEQNKEAIASPQQVDDTDFGLSNEVSNKDFLLKLKKKSSVKKVGSVTLLSKRKLPIFNTGAQEDNGYYWVEDSGKIIWLVKYKKLRRNWLPTVSVLTQVLLWRDLDSALPGNFTRLMFFNFIFKRHPAILSDKEHTPHGERFWRLRLAEAFKKNLNIALINLDKQESIQVTSADELVALFKKAWGPARENQRFRWIIWK